MAIQQPIGTDSLNSPSHSKLHRVIAADNTAPDESLAVSADGAIKQKQIASSTTPASGENKLYFKSDDKLYKKDSAGAEVEVGSGTGSGDFLADGSVPMTGRLDLATGTTTLAPIKMTAGVNLTTPVAGVMEFDGTDLFFSI